MTPADVIGDREAAELFGIAESTLKRHCMADFVCPSGKVDVRHAFPVIVGRKRRWNRQRILELLDCPLTGRQ